MSYALTYLTCSSVSCVAPLAVFIGLGIAFADSKDTFCARKFLTCLGFVRVEVFDFFAFSMCCAADVFHWRMLHTCRQGKQKKRKTEKKTEGNTFHW